MSFQQPVPQGNMYPPQSQQGQAAPLCYPVPIEFTTRFWGGNRFISLCTVTFDSEGFGVTAKGFGAAPRDWRWESRF